MLWSRLRDSQRTIVLAATLLVSLGFLAHGFSGGFLDTAELWRTDGIRKLEYFAGIYWAVGLAIWYFRKNLIRPIVLATAAVVVLAVTGPWVLPAVVIFFLASWSIGALLFRSSEGVADESEALRVCAGISLIETFVYATARIQIYYRAALLVLLLIPIFLRWREARALIGCVLISCRSRMKDRWEAFAEMLLSFILFCSLLLALSPEVGTDALAMHLAVGTNMAVHHRFTFTPADVTWSVMPVGADFCFAIANVLGGETAVRLQNFGFLALLLTVLFFIGRRLSCRTADLYLALAMFASTSLVQFSADSVMVENLWALLCAALLLTVLKYFESGRDWYLFLFAMLGCGAMMIKLGSLAFVTASLPFLIYCIWRNAKACKLPTPRILVGAGAMLLTISSIPYAIAYAFTGNPVFPFGNAVWKSPLLNASASLVDPRWRAPIYSTILFDLTFQTGKYLESRPGGIGYTLLLFALPCLAVIAWRWKFAVACCTLLPLLFFSLTFGEVRYIRYLYPGLAVIAMLAVYPLAEAHRLKRWLYVAFVILGVAGTGLNYYFAPAFSGYQGDFYNLRPKSREQYQQAYLRPISAITYLNRSALGKPVLFVDTVDIAGLLGQPYSLTWHFYPITKAIQNARTFAQIRKILADHSVEYIARSIDGRVRWPVRSEQQASHYEWNDIYVPALFDEFLKNCTVSAYQTGLWEIRKVTP